MGQIQSQSKNIFVGQIQPWSDIVFGQILYVFIGHIQLRSEIIFIGQIQPWSS